MLGIEQWLDTISISSGEECLGSRVVQTESELAAQVLEERSAMELVQCDDNFAIALTLEDIAGVFLELLASGIGLVQLAVHDGVNVSI